MKVELLHNTPLVIDAVACRTCWSSQDKSDTNTNEKLTDEIGVKDKELIERVGNKFKHKSVLEHVSYNFFISGISRALLQELARHRTAKLSVKSTRYTLKELKQETCFNDFNNDIDYQKASQYLVWTGNKNVDCASFIALEELRILLKQGISNDIAKYAMPECYKTELTWTIDARNLQNFLSLRSDKSALWEIQQLANEIYEKLPDNHKYLFVDYMKNKTTK